MIEIAFLREKDKFKAIPNEVQQVIQSILKILASEYKEDRLQYEDDGGFIVIIEKSEDFQVLKEKTYIDCNSIIPEYVDKILCSNGKVYTNSLILCNNDYAISLTISMELTPQNLKDYMID